MSLFNQGGKNKQGYKLVFLSFRRRHFHTIPNLSHCRPFDNQLMKS